MKILKYGEGYPTITICDNCKSTLQYDFKDIYDGIDRVRPSDPLVVYEDVEISYVWCPVCGHQVIVGRKVIYTECVDPWWDRNGMNKEN